MRTMAASSRLRELALLLEAGKAMNSLLELPQVLAAILRSAVELLGAANGSVMLLHEGGTELRSVCWFGDDAAGDARRSAPWPACGPRACCATPSSGTACAWPTTRWWTFGDGLVAAGAVVLRLAGGNGGIVPPEEFLDVAEDTRLIVPLGNWAVREACRQAALSRADDDAGPVAVHIEVSAVQLHAGGFAAAVAAAVVHSGLDARRLFLTVSETALPRLTPAAVATLEELAATGVHVGIAGFGAGQTALPELRRLPIDFLTMDPSLVRGIDDNARAASVVESVVRAAAALHLTVVAAGVETDEQAGALRRLGCSRTQGPYFGRPRGSFPWPAGWD
ncbi:MAG: EAL domain-containing protein [Actinomycetota bacterium]|nr:EAL domain-containing protein [Actinomycetota bacterium]